MRDNRIEAVLCAPIGDPPVGVLYLQERATPGPFTDHDRELVEAFARTVALLTDLWLLVSPSVCVTAPTRPSSTGAYSAPTGRGA